jgi:hypothetical protein
MDSEQKRVKLAAYRKESPRCIFIKKNGTRCKGIASKQTNMCPSHSGFIPQLQRKGVDLVLSNDLLSLKKFLCQLAMDIKKGKIKPQVGNAVKNVTDSVIKVEEDLTLQAEMREMRILLGQADSADYEELQSLGVLESEFKE